MAVSTPASVQAPPASVSDGYAVLPSALLNLAGEPDYRTNQVSVSLSVSIAEHHYRRFTSIYTNPNLDWRKSNSCQ